MVLLRTRSLDVTSMAPRSDVHSASKVSSTEHRSQPSSQEQSCRLDFFHITYTLVDKYFGCIHAEQGDHTQTMRQEFISQHRCIHGDFHHINCWILPKNALHTNSWYIRNNRSTQRVGKTRVNTRYTHLKSQFSRTKSACVLLISRRIMFGTCI